MKYVFISIAALAACIAAGFLLTKLIWRKGKQSGKKMMLRSILLGMAAAAVTAGVYLSVYYHADPECETCLISSDSVNVEEIRSGYFFDGKGTEQALIFYPGAKVDTKAYAPLMYEIAENGTDCFLIKMPAHMAVLGINKAEAVMNEYSYDSWYLSGHSLGGTAASLFAVNHPEKVDGLILLASYPTKEISDSIGLLSVYGENDGCLEKEVYEENKKFWPSDSAEYVIEGGNHADFGLYGAQRGDGQAEITPEEQIRETADQILTFTGN